MSCGRKEPGHQQPWYLLCWTELTRSLHGTGFNKASEIVMIIDSTHSAQGRLGVHVSLFIIWLFDYHLSCVQQTPSLNFTIQKTDYKIFLYEIF